ncbi:MAG: type VI secretion system Vgr family protein, partial [Duganella sp.]
AGGTEKSNIPMHTLVLFNIAENLRRNAAGTVRYHRDSATEERDAITSWTAMRTLQAGAVTRHSWNYRNPPVGDLMMAYARSSANQGVHGNELAASLDDYQIEMPHAGDDSGDLCRLGLLRMNRHDYDTKCFHGEGSVRDFCAGEYFTLDGHPEVDQHPAAQREFVLTALRVHAQNNLPKALAERVERLFARSRWGQESADALALREAADAVATGPLRMHVQFTAVRRGVKIVPAYDARTDLPPALIQSAIVVGPKGEEVHCDRLGRVKIRFPGTRPEDHVASAGAGASDTDRDSAWVRVASNWAGNGPGSLEQCGTVGLPRVGTEVLVNFLGGDPDRPVIVGQMYNQMAQPPALSEAGCLPGNRYLSGMRSREVRGQRANQLRFDDTTGEISAQLASEHGASQLNLGWLTEPRADGMATQRGSGAELRSDLNTVVRGQQGVLITAESSDAQKGKHLDRPELLRIADALQKLSSELSAKAEQHAGDKAPGKELPELIEKLRELEDKGAPVIALSALAGSISTSTRNLAIGAGTSIDIVSAEATALTSGDTTTIRAVQDISVFSNEGSIKLTAASGKVSIHAQNEQLQLLAKKVVEIISSTDWITIKARKGVRINGGGTELELSADGIKGYTSGKHEMYAADHQTFPGQSRSVKFADNLQPHKICVPCLLIAASAHSPFAKSK